MSTKEATGQTTTTIRKLMDGKLRLETRNGNPTIYARTYLQGKNLVHRTRETRIQQAEKIAIDWWFGLRDRLNSGERLHDPTFCAIAEKFLAIAHRDHNEGQVRNFRQKWSLLKKEFGNKKPSEIDKGWLLDLRGKRAKVPTKSGEPVKPATLKKDLLFIRLVLRYAKDEAKCLKELPDFPSFTRNSKWEIRPSARPRFDKDEFKTLVKSAWRRMREPDLNPRTRRQRTELYYFILIATGAALRVDEAYSLRWCDCGWHLQGDADLLKAHVTTNGRRGRFRVDYIGANLLKAMVLGKHSRNGEREEAHGNPLSFAAFTHWKRQRGVEAGFVWVRSGALDSSRIDLPPEDKVFRHRHRDAFRELLIAADLRKDYATQRTRNLKSLRPTGISLRLEQSENPNYIDIAKWTRTSVAMIEKFYDQRERDETIARVMLPPNKDRRS